MPNPRRLTPQQARDVVAAAERGIPKSALAAKFAVSYGVIDNVVTGRSYGDVTGRRRNSPTCCDGDQCRSCREEAVLDNNVESARAVEVEVTCTACGTECRALATSVLRMRGRVLCRHCDGRKAVRR